MCVVAVSLFSIKAATFTFCSGTIYFSSKNLRRALARRRCVSLSLTATWSTSTLFTCVLFVSLVVNGSFYLRLASLLRQTDLSSRSQSRFDLASLHLATRWDGTHMHPQPSSAGNTLAYASCYWTYDTHKHIISTLYHAKRHKAQCLAK